MRITVWNPCRKVNHLSKFVFQFYQNKVSKDKDISRWVDRKNLSVLDDIESQIIHKAKKVTDREKRSKTPSEVTPVENISKDLQSFLEVNLVQKEVFTS